VRFLPDHAIEAVDKVAAAFECEHVTWEDITGVVRLINQSSIFLTGHQTSHECSVMFAMRITYVISFSVLYVFLMSCVLLIPARPNLSSIFKVCLMLCEILSLHIFIGTFVCVRACVCVYTQTCAPNQAWLIWLVTAHKHHSVIPSYQMRAKGGGIFRHQ